MTYSRIKLCPVTHGRLYSDEAIFYLNVPDGWHKVDVFSREHIVSAEIKDLLVYKSPVKAYFLRGQLVPKNFDTAKRYLGDLSLKDYLLGKDQAFRDFDVLAFCKIRNKIFFVRKEDTDGNLFMPKLRLENDEKLENSKGLTPEQVYLLGCYSMILAEQKARLEAETLPNRIKKLFSLSGAKLIEFKIAAKGLIDVIWQYLDHTFLSTVDEKTLRTRDNAAGVCLAGTDSRQTLASLPFIVKEAVEKNKLVITRHVDNEDDE